MELIIRNTTNQPIYDQIYSQIKAQIIAGKLSPGEALPSIRALAKDLRISVITTKRAWTPPWSWPPSAASRHRS